MANLDTTYLNRLVELNEEMKTAFSAQTLSESVPKATEIKNFFIDTVKRTLTYFKSSEISIIGNFALAYCDSLKTLVLENVGSVSYRGVFRSDSLEYADLGTKCYNIGDGAFMQGTSTNALKTLIIRNENSVCSLYSTSSLSNTPISRGEGYIFVPDSLLERYKTANNWSEYSANIKGLSELEVTV